MAAGMSAESMGIISSSGMTPLCGLGFAWIALARIHVVMVHPDQGFWMADVVL